MYLPARFDHADREDILSVVRDAPLATLIAVRDGEPVINHIPLVYQAEENKLIGHIARANEMWKFLENAPVTAVFHGPNAYISPVWYPKDDVPTWNYAVVHMRGRAKMLSQYSEILECLRALSAQANEGATKPWRFWLPEDLRGETVLPEKIVGFEINVETISAKFKLSQNRSADEIQGAIAGLESEKRDDSSRRIAKLMRKISAR